jgi:hypothetical protein
VKSVTKGLIGLAALASVPAAAAMLGGERPVVLEPTHLASKATFSIRDKNQDRLAPHATVFAAVAKGPPLIHLAQAGLNACSMPPPMPDGPPPLAVPPPFHMPPEGPLPQTGRAACEERAHFNSALVGYYKSKLRLEGAQREAWAKLEQAADAGIEKLHAACDALPVDADAPLNVLETLDIIVRQNTADLEFVAGLREPLRALYEALTPKQQRLLLPPAPPARIGL